MSRYPEPPPLGTLPGNIEPGTLPVFEPNPSNGLAQLVAQVAPRSTVTQPLPPATPNSFSPTARLPQKLVTRINSLEFVEMSELLPEAWVPEPHDQAAAPRRPSRCTPVTDILVWTECYSLMAAVLAEKYPDKAPQFLAYLRRIVHAARNFHGTAWVAYDRLYHRQALT